MSFPWLWILVALWNTVFFGFLFFRARKSKKCREESLSKLELCRRHTRLAQEAKTYEEYEFHMVKATDYYFGRKEI